MASRAYLAFRDVRALGRFYTDFSQQLFVDEKGREYRPLIEYAPYQRLPAALSGAGAGAKKKPAKPAAKGRPDSAPSLSAPALPLLDGTRAKLSAATHTHTHSLSYTHGGRRRALPQVPRAAQRAQGAAERRRGVRAAARAAPAVGPGPRRRRYVAAPRAFVRSRS